MKAAWARARRIAPHAIIAAQLAAAVCIAIDLMLPGAAGATGAAGSSLAALGHAAVVCLGLGAGLGALLGAAMAAIAGAPARPPRRAGLWAAAIALAGWLALHAYAVEVVTRRFHDPTLMAAVLVVIALGLLAPALVAYLLLRRAFGTLAAVVQRRAPRAAPWLAELPIAAIAALAAARIDHAGATGVGPVSWRWILLVAGFALLARAGHALLAVATARNRAQTRPRRALPIAATAATALAVGLALSPLGHDARLQRGAIVPAVTALLRPLLDRDGDGVLAVLGDRDCGEGDATRSPRGIEIADNGVDEDCRYGDWRPPPAASLAASAPAAPAADTIVLLTLGGIASKTGSGFSVSLPALTARIAAGRSYPDALGLAGRLRDVAPVLLSGRLPGADRLGDSGFPAGLPTVPMMAVRAGWQIGISLPKKSDLSKLGTAFPPERSREHPDAIGVLAQAAELLSGTGPAFVWAHLDIAGKSSLPAVDAAIDGFIGQVQQRGSYRVLIVTLSANHTAEPPPDLSEASLPRGGPVALLGNGFTTQVVHSPVGIFDVYPTLLALLGLAPADSAPAEPAPAEPTAGVPAPSLLTGTSLVDPPAAAEPGGGRAEAVLTGWLGERPVLVAAGGGLLVSEDLAGAGGLTLRRGDERRHLSETSDSADAAEAAHLRLLRDGFLAPRLRRRNQLRAVATVAAPPAELHGSPAVIDGALHVLGCTQRELADDRFAITLYLRGGERLRAGDALELMVKSNERRTVATLEPLDGAYRFGTWDDGVIVAQPVVFDRRLTGREPGYLWVAVTRDGKRLPVSEGEGVALDSAPVCMIE